MYIWNKLWEFQSWKKKKGNEPYFFFDSFLWMHIKKISLMLLQILFEKTKNCFGFFYIICIYPPPVFTCALNTMVYVCIYIYIYNYLGSKSFSKHVRFKDWIVDFAKSSSEGVRVLFFLCAYNIKIFFFNIIIWIWIRHSDIW